MSLPISRRKTDVVQRYRRRRDKDPMNEARRERVLELIRSLELVQLRRQTRCQEGSAFEERSSSSPTETDAGKGRKKPAHRPCEDRDDIQAPSIT